jgi:hypothetical protein
VRPTDRAGSADGANSPAAGTRPPAWRLVLAIALPLIAVAVVVLLAKKAQTSVATDPTAAIAVAVVPQPGSTTAGCAALDAALPDQLDGHPRRTMVVPEPGVAAWGDPPVVMRCGISDPDELTCSAELTVYNGVSWLSLTGPGSTTYIAVDRASRVALTLDDSVGVGAVQALSDVIKTVMAERQICVDGSINPAA